MKTGTVKLRITSATGDVTQMPLQPGFSKAMLIKQIYDMFVDSPSKVKGPLAPKYSALTTKAGISPATSSLPSQLKPLLTTSFSVKAVSGGGRSGLASRSTPGFFKYSLGDFQQSRDAGATTGTFGTQMVSWVDTRTGLKNPYWKSQVQSGASATTGMTAVRYEIRHMPASFWAQWKNPSIAIHKTTQSDAFVGCIIPITLPAKAGLGTLAGKVENGAIGKLHDKLYALQHSADIGEGIAEYAQALRMLSRPLAGMRDLIDKYHQRSLDMLRRPGYTSKALLQALGALWLEFNFGWKPLALDVLGVINALQDKRNSITGKVSASFRDHAQVANNQYVAVGLNYGRFNVTDITTVRYTVRYMFGINVVKVDALSFANQIGLELPRFVPTLYAVLPYSWLFDYFTGLNNVVNSLCDDFDFVTWGNKTTRQESIREIVSNPDIGAMARACGPDFKGGGGSPGVDHLTRFDISRSATSLPVAPIKIGMPRGWRPAINVASLFAARKMVGLAGASAAILLAAAKV